MTTTLKSALSHPVAPTMLGMVAFAILGGLFLTPALFGMGIGPAMVLVAWIATRPRPTRVTHGELRTRVAELECANACLQLQEQVLRKGILDADRMLAELRAGVRAGEVCEKEYFTPTSTQPATPTRATADLVVQVDPPVLVIPGRAVEPVRMSEAERAKLTWWRGQPEPERSLDDLARDLNVSDQELIAAAERQAERDHKEAYR